MYIYLTKRNTKSRLCLQLLTLENKLLPKAFHNLHQQQHRTATSNTVLVVPTLAAR